MVLLLPLAYKTKAKQMKKKAIIYFATLDAGC